MKSASRRAAQNEGSPSMKTRSIGSASWAIAPCSAVQDTVRLMLEDAFPGRRTASGASMMAEKAARVSASGATVTG